MLTKIRNIWDGVRRAVCQKRIYRYGTNALFIFDDRTRLEKLCDAVDNWFFNAMQKKRYEQAKERMARSMNWTDKLGNTREKVLDSESKGYAYMSDREWCQMANNAKARREKEDKIKTRKKVEALAYRVAQGEKFNTPEKWKESLKRCH